MKRKWGASEISPDNQYIAFTYRASNKAARVWLMNRNGSDPHELYNSSSQEAHDPTWSPDRTHILFAMGRGDTNKLYIMSFDRRDPHVVNNSIDTRGRSDWSINNLITFDMGGPFQHDVYTMNVDGSNLDKFSDGTDQRQLTKNDYCDYQPRWGN